MGLEIWLIGYISDVHNATAALVRAGMYIFCNSTKSNDVSALELDHPSKATMGIVPLR